MLHDLLTPGSIVFIHVVLMTITKVTKLRIFFADVVVAPPSCYLSYVRQALPATIGVSAQNCYKAEKGAFTGEIR